MLEFRLLGQISLGGVDGAQMDALLRQPKRLALLAYLSAPVPGTWHRRDTLLTLFWPDLDTAHARTALRNSLYVLRQTLGDRVIRARGDEELSVDPDELSTDLAALTAALDAGRVEEALSHFRGELLPALFPPDSGGFQRWLDGERSRLRLRLAGAAVARIAALEREGPSGEALALARSVLELQPDDETAVRRKIALHAARGDRAGGLATYEDYRVRLAREFDAQPAPETVAMAERLRERVPMLPPPRETPAAPAGPRPAVSGPSAPSAAHRQRARRRTGIVVALMIALTLTTTSWIFLHSPSSLAIGKSLPLTFEEGLQIDPAISPNGRLVAFAKGTPYRMRVFVQRIAGDRAWPLTSDTSAMELMPQWSPDNDEVLFLARNSAWVVPSIGGTPRLVARGAEGDSALRSASWSPTGDSIAIVRNDSLMVRPLQGPGSRYVGSGPQLHDCEWSPDGIWIACVSGNLVSLLPGTTFGNRAPSAIVIFPAAGGTAIEITAADKEHVSPAWSADSRYLWFVSDRDGTSGELYAVPIGHDGHAAGAIERMGAAGSSLSLAGRRIAYANFVRKANVWAVTIPVEGAATLNDAVRVTSGNEIVEIVRVSRDGRWLVYDSDARGNSDIYRVPVAGGAPERLTDDPRNEFAGDLSPNNADLAYHVFDHGKRYLAIKHLENGAVTVITPASGDRGTPRWSPDGSAIAAWDHSVESGSILVIRRTASGWSAPIWMLSNAQLPVWSPDGRSLAFVTADGSVRSIAADSGPSRVLYASGSFPNSPVATQLAWNAGRPELWFLGHDLSGRRGIWALPPTGGRPRLVADLTDEGGRLNGLTIASDGRRLYFTLEERSSNVRWAELVRR